MASRNEFPTPKSSEPKAFTQLVRQPKPAVTIAGDNDFSRGGLTLPRKTANAVVSKPVGKHRGNIGRPKKNPLYTATLPQRVSPATKAKLDVLQEYVTELSAVDTKVTFDVLVSALADAYVNQRLSTAKSEHFKDEYEEALHQVQTN